MRAAMFVGDCFGEGYRPWDNYTSIDNAIGSVWIQSGGASSNVVSTSSKSGRGKSL